MNSKNIDDGLTYFTNVGVVEMDHDTTLKHIDSKTLMEGKKEVIIVHHGEEYRLRITSQGKLMLTKK